MIEIGYEHLQNVDTNFIKKTKILVCRCANLPNLHKDDNIFSKHLTNHTLVLTTIVKVAVPRFQQGEGDIAFVLLLIRLIVKVYRKI